MKQLFTVALLAVLFVSCKKEKDGQDSQGTDFTSIRKYDVDANFLGTLGNATDDYRQEEWPNWVIDLFKPLDTVSLVGYLESECAVDRLYPNPCANNQTMRYFATQPANLKILIVDEFKNAYFLKSYHAYSSQRTIEFDYSDLGLQPNTFYRMFYAFSAEDKPYFVRGHIDILKSQ